MTDTLEICLDWLDQQTLIVKNHQGQSVVVSGKEAILPGMRPMELFLSSLAGCSAIDVVHILKRGRHQLESLSVRVQGKRTDAIPAVFTEITMEFIATGELKQAALQRAIDLSLQKYCSVARMLDKSVTIHSTCRIEPSIETDPS